MEQEEKKLPASSNGNGKGKPNALSRRNFLKTAGATVAGIVGVTAAGCEVDGEQGVQGGRTVARVPIQQQFPAVPYTPSSPPPEGVLSFFTVDEARTVEAFTARLLPGTPEDPGAREAGVVFYVDRLLSLPDGIAEPAYLRPPFAEPYSAENPPDLQQNGFNVIYVPEEEIERYGMQFIFTPREAMRVAIAGINRYANQLFESDFADLEEEQQDQIIQAMLEEDVEGFEPLASDTVFHMLRRYTAEGMFSDPVYGGNRNFAGWRLVGYPGAQRAYTPAEVKIEGSGLSREIWGMGHLPVFNPGQADGPNVILPARGSDEHIPLQENPANVPEHTPQHVP